MKSFDTCKLRRTIVGCFATLLLLTVTLLSPASAVDIPTDDERDVLVRTTLMTFNDANMTNNYSVLYAKASKQFRSQLTIEKLTTAFEPFRKDELFFESIITDEYDSQEKAKLDSEGALVLNGVFKDDELQIKFKLRFIQNEEKWKLLGINVDVKKM